MWSPTRNLPLVFHCAAGKDRTGVLAALVLDILDVDDEAIVADYLVTAARMDLILGRYRSDPALAERMASVPASRFSVEAETMVRFLAGSMNDRFGGSQAWALAPGVAPAHRADARPASRAGPLRPVLNVRAGRRGLAPRAGPDPAAGWALGGARGLWEPFLAGTAVFLTLMVVGLCHRASWSGGTAAGNGGRFDPTGQ